MVFFLPILQAYNVVSLEYHHAYFISFPLFRKYIILHILYNIDVHTAKNHTKCVSFNVCDIIYIFFFLQTCVSSLGIILFEEKYYFSGCMECERVNIVRANNIINTWINQRTRSNRNTHHRSQYYYIIPRRKVLITKSV